MLKNALSSNVKETEKKFLDLHQIQIHCNGFFFDPQNILPPSFVEICLDFLCYLTYNHTTQQMDRGENITSINNLKPRKSDDFRLLDSSYIVSREDRGGNKSTTEDIRT